MTQHDIPLINLDLVDDATVAALRKAAQVYGTAHITSSALATVLAKRRQVLFTTASHFFTTNDHDVKQQYAPSYPVNVGYSSRGRYQSPNDNHTSRPAATADVRETFSMGNALPSPKNRVHYLTAPNIFPDDAVAPGFSKAMQEYYDAMQEIGHQVMALLSKAMGLPSETLSSMASVRPLSLLVSHYPPTQESEEQLMLGAHKDLGLITLLATEAGDDALEILLPDGGTWVPVQTQPDAIVLNLGRMMELLTNKEFVAIEHRVNNKRGVDRYSCAAFFSVDPWSMLTPLGDFAGSDLRVEPKMAANHVVDFGKSQVVSPEARKAFEPVWEAFLADTMEMAQGAGQR